MTTLILIYTVVQHPIYACMTSSDAIYGIAGCQTSELNNGMLQVHHWMPKYFNNADGILQSISDDVFDLKNSQSINAQYLIYSRNLMYM